MEEPRSLRSQEGKKAKLEPWASGAGMLGAWFEVVLLGMRLLNPEPLSLNPEPRSIVPCGTIAGAFYMEHCSLEQH